jgi:hypothetical protein
MSNEIRLDEDEVEERAMALMAGGACFDRASATFIATRELKAEAEAASVERAARRESHHPRAKGRRERTVLV